jgi:outer membrane murein-binding lipoprotein Lpp
MSACARTLYRRLELAATTARLREQNADLRFISSQQTARVDQLTSENTSLRARLNDALMQNGIVLPSGHEVRWHGHKEHMKAHSPLAPAAEAEPAAKVAPGTPSAPMAGGLTTTERATMVRQLRAAARQASNLQFRLEDAEARAARLEMESKALREAAVGRDAELERLQRAAAEVREGAQLSAVHVNEEKNLTIAQLNHQVDFLNSQCATLESELAEARHQAEAAAETEARVDRLMGAVRELRDDNHAPAPARRGRDAVGRRGERRCRLASSQWARCRGGSSGCCGFCCLVGAASVPPPGGGRGCPAKSS